jgi:folate-dependent phosphoribosylglycinamide formyltransferase PurN
MNDQRGRDAAASVALLTVEGPASRVLANVLNAAGLLQLIVVESPPSTRLTRSARRLLRYVTGVLGGRSAIESPERHIEIELLNAAQRRVTERYPASYSEWPSSVTRLRVDDLNGDRCRDALATQRPEVIAVFRTRILREHVFNLARLGAVNCHYSLLPEYRGTFVEFWQRLNRDLQTAGVTFHFLDEGVDTGDIIASIAHEDLPDEITPFDLRYRNYMLMLEHFPGILRSVLDGRCDRHPQPHRSSHAYRSRDLTDERRRDLYRQLGLLTDPHRAGGGS